VCLWNVHGAQSGAEPTTDDEETKMHEAYRPDASQSGVTNGD
jgi:hypothetical protein